MPSQGNQQLIEREVRSLKDESQRFTKQTQAWMTAVDDFKNEVNVRARHFFAPRAECSRQRAEGDDDVRSQLLGLFQDYAAEVEGEMRTVVRPHSAAPGSSALPADSLRFLRRRRRST